VRGGSRHVSTITILLAGPCTGRVLALLRRQGGLVGSSWWTGTTTGSACLLLLLLLLLGCLLGLLHVKQDLLGKLHVSRRAMQG